MKTAKSRGLSKAELSTSGLQLYGQFVGQEEVADSDFQSKR